MKSESLGVSLTRSILVVSIIVAVGAILGAAGYLAKNKQETSLPPQASLSPVPTVIATPIVKDETADWQTYSNDEYGYKVKFPADLVLQKNTGEAYVSFLGKLAEKNYFLQFGYISQDILNTMGASYCQSYPNDSRCENFSSNGLRFLIDWNIETEGAFTASRAEILKPEGGMVVISILHSPSQDIKLFFRQILSTFKFTEKDSAFSCGNSTVTDIDNNIYNTVKIGEQCWLKENLKVKINKNPQGETVANYCPDNNVRFCMYGRLYDWNTAMNGATKEGNQGICPSGWHIPKDSEWHILENSLTIDSCSGDRIGLWDCDSVGTKLKNGGSSGFESFLTGGYEPFINRKSGSFSPFGREAYFWSSTEDKDKEAWYRILNFAKSTIARNSYNKSANFSVRCLKD